MAQGTVTLAGNISGGPMGARSLLWAIPLATAVDQMQTLTLSSGANTITVPSGTTVMVILGPNSLTPAPNPTSTAVLTVKGVAGDTGVVVSSKWPTMLSWDTPPSSVVVNASGATTAYVWFA